MPEVRATQTAPGLRGVRLVAGAYDAMSAALVQRAGFDAVWASGFSISASRLLPDCNAMTVNDLADRVAQMTPGLDVPIVVDCDEGYGPLEDTRRLIRRLAACGVAGVCIEDTVYPKTNSFCDDPSRALVELSVFAEKVKAVKEEAPHLVVIARTESLIAGYGLQDAVARADQLAQLGVDYVIIHSRYRTINEFRWLASAWSGRAPLIVIPTLLEDGSWRDLLDLGFAMVIYANQTLRAAVTAQERILEQILDLAIGRPGRQELASLDHLFDLTNLRPSLTRLT